MNINFKNPQFNKLYQDYITRQKSLNIIAKDKINSSLKRLNEILDVYRYKCKALYNNISARVNKKEYAIKGEYLVRGYYCPSPIKDIIVGNSPRGKILKSITSVSKPTYEYGFDAGDNLILVKYIHLDEFDKSNYEILLHEDNCVIGIFFTLDGKGNAKIRAINESTYDNQNRIISFINGYVDENDFYDIEQEIYSYDESGLKTTELCNCIESAYTYELYTFYHNSDGDLNEYFVEPRMFPDQKYKVNIKRKV